MKIRLPSVHWQAIAALTVTFLFPLTIIAAETETSKIDLDFSTAAVKRGAVVFTVLCQNCHSVKYLGYQARLSAKDTQSAFGKAPPDLSLMAKARGRESAGEKYIYALLLSYDQTPQKNSLFPYIAMPPPFSQDDPERPAKAKDVAAFLYFAAEPAAAERKMLGSYVIGYMIILTVLLYLLNRKTWKRIKKKSMQ